LVDGEEKIDAWLAGITTMADMNTTLVFQSAGFVIRKRKAS
jgi:hypothetical protein